MPLHVPVPEDRRAVDGRLVVRRIPDLNPNKVEQPTLFDVYRHHAFFTTHDKRSMGTVAADKTHRGHAIIEQVHADLKGGAAHALPSGVFTANSAWLVLAVIAFNLTRAAGLIADRAGAARQGDDRDDPPHPHPGAGTPRGPRVASSSPARGLALADRVRSPVHDHAPTTGNGQLTIAATAALTGSRSGRPG